MSNANDYDDDMNRVIPIVNKETYQIDKALTENNSEYMESEICWRSLMSYGNSRNRYIQNRKQTKALQVRVE